MGFRNKGAYGKKPYTPKPKAPKAEIPVHTLSLPTFPSVGAWIRDGMQKQYTEELHKARDEAGRLRGGSVGTFLTDGRTYTGTCLRASLARFMGAEPPREMKKHLNTMLMFESGKGSEELILKPFLAGLPAGYSILREEEFPIKWSVGTEMASGREDFIVLDETKKPVGLVEAKAVSSLQAENVFDEKPKMEHVIQLANYMYRTGLPGQLLYRSGVIMPLPDWPWVMGSAPKSQSDTTPGHELVEWSKGGKRGPQPTKLRPFMRSYHMAFHEGVLYYSRASDDDATHVPKKWVRTPITTAGIDEYYAAILEQRDTQTLAPPNTPVEIDGSKKTYKACDYCDWSKVCASAQNTDKRREYADWKEQVQSLIPPPEKK